MWWGAVELTLDHLLRLLGDGFQTLDKETGDTGNEFHNGTHRDSQKENLLDIELSQTTDEGTNNDAQHQRFTQHAELLLQAVGIDIQAVEAWNHIKRFADNQGKRHKALTERLRDADALPLWIVFLELVGCKVCHHERDNIAHNGGKVAPRQRLVHHEICHSTNEGEVPVVPEVDIDSTRTLGDDQQEVDTQTDRNDECANRCIVSHSSCSRPPHIKNLQLQVVQLADSTQRTTKVRSKQGGDDSQADETHADIQSTLQRASESKTNAEADNREENRHHNTGT